MVEYREKEEDHGETAGESEKDDRGGRNPTSLNLHETEMILSRTIQRRNILMKSETHTDAIQDQRGHSDKELQLAQQIRNRSQQKERMKS
jgi:hypothetical protein